MKEEQKLQTSIKITTRIEITLSVDESNNLHQREVLLNGKKIYYDEFDKRFLAPEDFIHAFTNKIINGLKDE